MQSAATVGTQSHTGSGPFCNLIHVCSSSNTGRRHSLQQCRNEREEALGNHNPCPGNSQFTHNVEHSQCGNEENAACSDHDPCPGEPMPEEHGMLGWGT
eukprot:scaffold19380_cov23-Tisochrysis_lutea.AAC.1